MRHILRNTFLSVTYKGLLNYDIAMIHDCETQSLIAVTCSIYANHTTRVRALTLFQIHFMFRLYLIIK